MKEFLLSSVFAVTFAMLCACGDDVTEVNEIHQDGIDGIAVLDAGLELSKQKCGAENAGAMLFVTDSAEVYFCDGETWLTLKGEKGADGENGSDGKPGINGNDGKSGKDGEKGKDGADGKDGEDGASCTAKMVQNVDKTLLGLEVTCGEIVVDTIWNGEDGEKGDDGKDGKDGEDGASCTAKMVQNVDEALSGLEVTCGTTIVDTIWNGKTGDKGDKGEKGDKGDDGNDGKNMVAFAGTQGSFVDNRDGHVYKTIVIGSQTWMAENLNYNLKVLPENTKDSVDFSWCADGNGCTRYGRLYTWAGAMDSAGTFSTDGAGCGNGNEAACRFSRNVRGICPAGWHLPSHREFEILINYIDPSFGYDHIFDARSFKTGYHLKATYDLYGYGNGDNLYGFTAIPAGCYNPKDGSFDAVSAAYFWSSTGYGEGLAYRLGITRDSDEASLASFATDYGRSVRCIYDN